MQYTSTLCVRIVALAGIALGHNIQMGPHSRECFHEQLHRDDKMTVTFQVGDREFGGAGNLEVDFWVHLCYLCLHCYTQRLTGLGEQIQDPNKGFQIHERGVSSGDYSFDAHADGKYIYCFSNEHSPAATKEVSFNVHGIVYVPEAEVSSDPLETEGWWLEAWEAPTEVGGVGQRTRHESG